MCGSGVDALEHGAVASLDALAAQQAANGQMPKYVDPEGTTPRPRRRGRGRSGDAPPLDGVARRSVADYWPEPVISLNWL